MKFIVLALLTAAFSFSVAGCSRGDAATVTEGSDQSEIEAWKEKQKAISASAEAEMME